jgi:hypothetical protein
MANILVKISTLKGSHIFRVAPVVVSHAVPLIVAAQSGGELDYRIANIRLTIDYIIGALFILATVIFLWGVVLYIRSSADEASRRKAQGIMMWGIIGLTVMTVAWGIVTILVNYFGLGQPTPQFRRYPT